MKQLFKATLLLLLTIYAGNVYARLNGQARTDSLLKELAIAKADTIKIDILLTLVYSPFQWAKDDSGLILARQAIALSDQLHWQKGVARGNYYLGRVYMHKGEIQKALDCFFTSLKISEELGNSKIACNAGEAIGNMYDQIGDYPRAMEYYFKSLKMAEQLNDTDLIAREYSAIAGICESLGEHKKALDYCFKALELFKKEGNKRETAWVYGNLGETYQANSEYAKALEYNVKSLQLSEELGFGFGIEYACRNLSSAYASRGEYVMALSYGQKCLEICIDIGDANHTSQALLNVGKIYASLIDADKMSAGISPGELPKGNYIPDASIPQSRAARIRIAIDYLQRGLDSAKKVQALSVMQESYEALAKIYKLSHDFERAMECYQSYVMIKDSIYSQKRASQITKLVMQKKTEEDSLKSAQARLVMEIKYKQQRNYTYLGIAGMLLFVGFSFFIIKERGKSEKERKKSDDLLLNILPGEVATELKATGTTTAKHYDDVTVLFTDFVNFTNAGERMSTQGLIDELHTCFKAFDEVTARYGIEKIKTIGDAYLAVCGLPTADPNHAENTVRAAIEINAFMQDRLAKLGNSTFEIRIGIHSGSVVAGIVGVKKFAYDIWGDTVNTAARMEQNSEAGKINISQTTYELVKDKIACEYRGEIDAKGKGVMKMYYVKPLNP